MKNEMEMAPGMSRRLASAGQNLGKGPLLSAVLAAVIFGMYLAWH
jgi:hypothetical protein